MITGGAGFIGSNLGEMISADSSNTVVLVDDLSLGKPANLGWAQRRSNCSFAKMDVCETKALSRLMKDVDLVLHQAGIPGVQPSLQDPLRTNRANVEGTLSCLRAAVEGNVEALICASSSAVYGDSTTPPVSEDTRPRPVSPYGASKLAAEHYCTVFAKLYGINAVSLRYFNVYGPRQDPSSEYAAVIPRFISCLLSGRRPTIFGDGNQTRDFIYVADVAKANCMAAESSKAAGKAYNVASGVPTTINRLLDLLGGHLGIVARADHRSARPGDIRHSWADTAMIRSEIGFEPDYDLCSGLKETVTQFKSAR